MTTELSPQDKIKEQNGLIVLAAITASVLIFGFGVQIGSWIG